MRFCGVVISRTGAPFEVLTVGENWQDVLGKPYHFRCGMGAESMRQLDEAVEGGKGYVVRVVPTSAKFPVVTLRDKVANEDPATALYNTHGKTTDVGSTHETVTTALPYGTDIVQNDVADIVSFYLIDGDNENKRFLKLEALDAQEFGANMKLLTLFEQQGDVIVELESHTVSTDIEARDTYDAPAFISDKLDANSKRVRCEVNMEKIAELTDFESLAFKGGTSGNMREITSADYLKAIRVLTNADPEAHAVLALGCYDDQALKELEQYAEDCRIGHYFDLEPNLSYELALARKKLLPVNSHYSCCYHFPYRCKDPFYGNDVSYGVSGLIFAAKAKGVASKAPVGAWHKVPAGMDRATVNRAGLVLNENVGTPNYDAMVKARINKVGLNPQGQPMIDDHLTCRVKSDDLRFEGIVAGDNYLKREWYKLTQQWKHEPIKEAMEGLTKGFIAILDAAKTAGIITPTSKGGDAFNFKIEEKGSDLLVAVWLANIQGSMRRSTGQCVLKSYDGE
ncbi:hypothetical protein [Vibrio sonorensis]|uniref:hypothetical protein n=1 Tax=Vibrio sonorensis TaxID=1004316 RepID=UPI0008DB0CF1|nr:hypothetical protein [Vibrio sonorensis]